MSIVTTRHGGLYETETCDIEGTTWWQIIESLTYDEILIVGTNRYKTGKTFYLPAWVILA
jgi:hypothetical protein